jgi:hypothetical protein
MPAAIEQSICAATCAGRFVRATWLAMLFLVIAGAGSHAAETTQEYKIKAAFLYNFAKFVEWPVKRFSSESAPIVIGILGEDRFAGEVERIVQDRKANGRDVTIVKLRSIAEADGVHILFVSAGEEKKFSASKAVRHPGMLTVGETETFEAAGGVITFTVPDDKVRFKINLDAANCSGLRISAQLQKVATVVRKKS